MAEVNLTWKQKLAEFPIELRVRRLWCVWGSKERANVKVPQSKINDPSTWITFEEACERADLDRNLGVGVLCDGSYTFIDLDRCVTAGDIEPWAKAVLLQTNSYAEFSLSETGLHIFLKGPVPKSVRLKLAGYHHVCSKIGFFIVTGRHIAGTPFVIANTNELKESNEEKEIMDNYLGDEVQDKITKFKGIAIGVADYLTGCRQYLVQPPVKADGEYAGGAWMDEDRLDVVTENAVTLEVKRDGPCGEAPKK